MNPQQALKTAVDAALTAALLLLMTYERIGQAAHEWLGIGMFALLILHHILNRKWSKALLKGKYTAVWAMQTALVAAVLFCMLGSMVSGMMLSRHAFAFLPVRAEHAFARMLHMLSAYWGLVLMSLHLGFHWGAMMEITKRRFPAPSEIRKWAIRAAAALLAGYGLYAFIRRDIGSYMFLKNLFVFFDFEEPVTLFVLDYAAIMGLFAAVGYYSSLCLRRVKTKRPPKTKARF